MVNRYYQTNTEKLKKKARDKYQNLSTEQKKKAKKKT